MDWREKIVVDPNILVGKPTIKGTRISVELIVDLLARGYNKEQILEQYDHLTPDDIPPRGPCRIAGSERRCREDRSAEYGVSCSRVLQSGSFPDRINAR